jgi:hypothetical protein
MRTVYSAVAALATLTYFAPKLHAQEKPKFPVGTLKVTAVISETEGEKKVSNLPYTFFVRPGEGGANPPWTKLRIGSRVPVATEVVQSGSAGDAAQVTTQWQFVDVGTSIDSRATVAENGQYDLSLSLERSWIGNDVPLPGSSAARPFHQPVIQQFKTELALVLHDGETLQTTQAADPVSGRILTLTVTLNVVK